MRQGISKAAAAIGLWSAPGMPGPHEYEILRGFFQKRAIEFQATVTTMWCAFLTGF